jgi:hypothetical protein
LRDVPRLTELTAAAQQRGQEYFPRHRREYDKKEKALPSLRKLEPNSRTFSVPALPDVAG